MSLKLLLHGEAKKELWQAFNWYEDQEIGLGYEFLISADSAKASALRDPEMYPKVYKDIRRVLVDRFPFSIYYAVRGQVLHVLAIFHARRNPNEWKKRARKLA